MACTDYNDMLGAHALDALASPEKEALAAHLAACPDCRRELEQLREIAGMLAYGAPDAPLPPGLKGRLMARLGPAAPAPVAPRRSGLWKAAAALATLGLLAALAWGLTLQTRLHEAEGRLARLEQQLAARADQLEVLKARDVQMTALEGQAPEAGAVARFIWSPERNSWLVAINGLSPAESGKTYQLWAVTPEAKHSLGTFQTGPDGGLIYEGDGAVPAGAIAAAVSLEPTGGVPQPTGPIVMVGALER